MPEIEESFFSEFKTSDFKDWEKVASGELKGMDLHQFIDKIKTRFHGVHPYSVAEDIQDLPIAEFEEILSGKSNKGWLIRQKLKISEIKKNPGIMSKSIEGGVDSIGIDMEQNVLSLPVLKLLFMESDIRKVELNFFGVKNYLESITNLVTFAESKYTAENPLRGSFGFDPAGDLIEGRITLEEFNTLTNQLIESLPLLEKPFMKYRPLVVNDQGTELKPTHPAHYLAFSLASAAEYMSLLTGAGKTSDQAASLIGLKYCIGFEYFIEMSKLRAARILWSKLISAFGAENRESYFANIHTECSESSYFIENHYDNLISGTTQAMSAVFGGCDSFSMAPFNGFSQFSLRITRNIQIIMKEEAFLDKVSNPAGGSWFIEKLTWEIVKTAWEFFQKIQNEGGLKEAVTANKLKHLITEKELSDF